METRQTSMHDPISRFVNRSGWTLKVIPQIAANFRGCRIRANKFLVLVPDAALEAFRDGVLLLQCWCRTLGHCHFRAQTTGNASDR